MWGDFLAAIALVMVLEGLMPFLSPSRMKRTFASISQMDERTLRIIGLFAMVAGALLLYFVRG
jgi:uncharacterized protein YjeT (DUF2065 family)